VADVIREKEELVKEKHLLNDRMVVLEDEKEGLR